MTPQFGMVLHFHITLDQDLQKDEEIKDDVMTLLGALITLKQDMERGGVSRVLWKEMCVECFK